jgi:hypothetical protein
MVVHGMCARLRRPPRSTPTNSLPPRQKHQDSAHRSAVAILQIEQLPLGDSATSMVVCTTERALGPRGDVLSRLDAFWAWPAARASADSCGWARRGERAGAVRKQGRRGAGERAGEGAPPINQPGPTQRPPGVIPGGGPATHRVVVQQVVDDRHPDLLDLRAARDLLARRRVGDVKGVGLAGGAAVELGAADVEAQVLQGGDLGARGVRGRGG